MQKRVSISDIAKSLSVSVSTVSRALHDHPSISDEMKSKVRAEVKEMNYRPNSYAVNLKKGSCMTIAVIVPLINRNFFSSVINGIEEVAYKNGYDVMIYQSRNDASRERHIVNSLSFGKVDGVIASLAAFSDDNSHYTKMEEYGMPLVLFDRVMEGTSSVRLNDYKGGYMVAEHMLSQGLKRIYHFAGPLYISVWQDRMRGYRDAMASYGVEIESSWIYESATNEKDGYEYMKMLIAKNDIPEAICFSGDYAALGAMNAMAEHGLVVGKDIAVSGFACEPFCDLLPVPLTSINQHSKLMGQEAAYMLLDKMAEKSPKNVILEPDLVIRESSKKRG